jgi:hypothetical protein
MKVSVLVRTELADLILDKEKLWCYAGLKHLLQLFSWLAHNAAGSGGVPAPGCELVHM